MSREQSQQRIRTDRGHAFAGKPSQVPVRDRAVRFVEMMRLLADGREWPVKRLSEELQVTVRTIHRDMEILQDRGMATRKVGRNASYRLVQETPWDQPRLTVREVIALLIAVGREFPQAEPDDGAALQAVVKILESQPEQVRQPLIDIVQLARTDSALDARWLFRQAWLATLLEGLIEARPLHVSLLHSAGDLAGKPLAVVPQSVGVSSQQWTLCAHRVSPEGGEVVLLLANVATLEFDATI